MNEFETLLNEYLPEEKKKGELIEGIILRKEKDFSYLDVNDKLEGKIYTNEIENLNVGEVVEVKIIRNDGENIIVSKFLLDKEKEFASYETGDIIQGEIIEKVKGGYKVKLGKNIGFLPFSISNLRRDDEYKNKKFKFLIIDKDTKNLTLSRSDLVKKEEEDFYQTVQKGDVLEGTIKEILDFGLIVDLGKTTGFIHISEVDWSSVKDLKHLFNANDKIKAKIIELDKENKKIKMSIKQMKEDPWNIFIAKYKTGDVLEAEVSEVMPFGIVVEHEHNRGFIHISEISWHPIEELSKCYSLGQKLKARIIEIDEKGRNYKLSVKQLDENPWDKLVENYKVGDTVEGVIEKILDFAILPSVDDVLGFIHISEISWGAHTGVIEQFKLGDTVKAKIIELNKDAKIFKLSIKRLSSDPWETVKEKYQKGQILTRKIKEILDFALLVEIEENVEGMVHISEISYRRVNNLKDKFAVGEEIKFKILEFNEEKRRVSLSMKAILDDIWANIHEKYTLNQEVSGKVINIQEYGIFGELEDGLEVFIHRNDFSWEKEEHKEYKLGDIVNFRILKIDEKEKKISGGIKQLTQSPWKEMESMYKIGNKVKVSVENEIENGYIVKLTDRFSALIPKKELPENTTLAVGDTVEGIITEMHEKRKSVILSVKKISEMEEEKELKELLEIYGVKKEEE